VPTAFARNRRRALELLAVCPEGCTEAILLAHGITTAQLGSLVRDGLAVERIERVKADKREMQVTRLHITAVGRQALGR
jgi:hypothetical protein